MLSINPFVELSNSIPIQAMQGFILLMILLVAGGTIYDMIEKQNATYFFRNWNKAKLNKKRDIKFNEILVNWRYLSNIKLTMIVILCNFRSKIIQNCG